MPQASSASAARRRAARRMAVRLARSGLPIGLMPLVRSRAHASYRDARENPSPARDCYPLRSMSAPRPTISETYRSAPVRPAPPDLASVDPSLDLPEEIRGLKRQKNAVLL